MAPGDDDAGCSDFVAAPSLIGSSICMNWPDYFNSWCVKKRVGFLMANILCMSWLVSIIRRVVRLLVLKWTHGPIIFYSVYGSNF